MEVVAAIWDDEELINSKGQKMSTVTTPGLNLWTNRLGQLLNGRQFNDVLHAINNSTTMVGGLGKDHFHVNMTAGSAVTGTKINDFNATQGDRLVLDGITDFDASKIAVALNSNGHDYDVSYDGTFVATVNLQYTPAGGTAVDWNPDLAQATAAITKMVRGGQADAKADYLYGTNEAQTFRYADRKLNVVNFSTGDKFDLSSLAAKIKKQYGNLDGIGFEAIGRGSNRYISVTHGGTEYMTVKLKAGEVNDQSIFAAQGAIFASLYGS